MTKRIISAILLGAMLISAMACGEQADSAKPASTTAVTEQVIDANETTSEVELQPDLPDYDCNGETFTFMVRGPSFNEWESQDIYAEEQDGEPINDAVYLRNLYVQEKYNVKIAQEGVSDPGSSGKKTVQAGDSVYDVFMANTS